MSLESVFQAKQSISRHDFKAKKLKLNILQVLYQFDVDRVLTEQKAHTNKQLA